MADLANISWNATSSLVNATWDLTPAELWTQLIGFYIILCGIISLFGNLLMAAGIIRAKQLRSRFFIVVCALLITRALFCFQMLIVGIYRSLRYLNVVGLYMTRFSCFMIHFNLIYAAFLEMLLLLVLVAERIAAVVAYKYYRRLKSRQALIICIFATVLSLLVKLVPWFFDVPPNEVIACININSPGSAKENAAGFTLDLTIAVLVLLLYIGLILYIRCYLTRSTKRNTGEQSAVQQALQRQLNLIPLLRRLVLIHCFFSLTSKAVLSVATLLPDKEVGYRVTAYGGMMITVDVFVNVVVLLTTNKELKEASLGLLGKKTMTVSVLTSKMQELQERHAIGISAPRIKRSAW